jgi:NAD(P)-dependent dehydrogenase (short-subunit alcohol dehydrogenase family)
LGLREVAEELQEAGAECLVTAADVTDVPAGDRVVTEVVDRWGQVDVLVNNAGVNLVHREMDDLSAEAWSAVLDGNLTGTFLLTRAVLPVMRSRRTGTIINVSSMAGCRASTVSGPAYTPAKAGVNSFTESLNLTEREHGIRACAVRPGEVATPIMDKRPVPPSPEARARCCSRRTLRRRCCWWPRSLSVRPSVCSRSTPPCPVSSAGWRRR